MLTATPENSLRLTPKQLTLLIFFYKYRFLTTNLTLQLLQIKNHSTINERLLYLLKLGLIKRDYGPSDRLQNKPAIYSLTTLGVATLRANEPNLPEAVLHRLYRDKTASDAFKLRCLQNLSMQVDLKERYGDGLKFVTNTELAAYDYLIRPAPDSYVVIDGASPYFIEQIQSPIVKVAVRKRITQYLDYFTKGDWEYSTGRDFPTVVFICETIQQCRTVATIVTRELERAFEDDLRIEILTYTQLRTSGLNTGTKIKA